VSRVEPRWATLTSGKRILLRTAEESDALASLRFEEHMAATNPYKVVLPGENPRNEEQQRQWIKEHLETDGWLAVAAFPSEAPDAEVIGKIMFRNGKYRRLAHHGTFGIDVHAYWRGRGVGTALIQTLLDWAAAHPVIEKVCLGVWASNTGARRLYRRLGFVIEGRSARHFRIGPGEHADDITMGVFVKPGLAPARYKTWPDCRPLP
jgi:RimJ/RimL family protein N-acetyltransferase